jgi:DNA repair and recombination protein RAD54B
MYRRQFVSPLLKRPLQPEDTHQDVSLEKKARLSVAQPLRPSPVLRNELPRTPLLNLQVPNYSPTGRAPQQEAYFNILWRNHTTKKNKTWDGDGVLSLEEGFLTIRDSDGKKQSLSKLKPNE